MLSRICSARSTAAGVLADSRRRASGRLLGQQPGDRVAQDGDDVVADQEGNSRVEDAGSKAGWASKTRSTPVSASRRELAQLDGQRRQPVLVADPGEQFVAEVPAQPRQRRRQRRLAEPHPRGGLRDAALLQQGVQRDQQVEVQAGQVHRASIDPSMPGITYLLFPMTA